MTAVVTDTGNSSCKFSFDGLNLKKKKFAGAFFLLSSFSVLRELKCGYGHRGTNILL